MRSSMRSTRMMFVVRVTLFGVAILNLAAVAQNQQLQQRVEEMKQAAAKNKQSLAQYTWVEQITISLKGEEKKQEHFQVRLGLDGKPIKTSLDPPPAASEPSGGRLKQHIVEKKKEEYKDYADEMKALAQQYIPPTPELLQKAFEQGNITLGTEEGDPNAAQFVIHSYFKPNDTVTVVFDRTQKAVTGIKVASYIDDPQDAMNLTVQFSRLPDGTNYASSIVIDGVKKQLNIAIQNSGYQHA